MIEGIILLKIMVFELFKMQETHNAFNIAVPVGQWWLMALGRPSLIREFCPFQILSCRCS